MKSKFEQFLKHSTINDFYRLFFRGLWIIFFAMFNFFLLLKVDSSAVHYTKYGYYFNYIFSSLFILWAFHRLIIKNILINNIIYTAYFAFISIRYYYFSSDISIFYHGMILTFISIMLKMVLPVIHLTKYRILNILVDYSFGLKIISIFYSFSMMTLFYKRERPIQDDFVLFYQSIFETQIFVSQPFIFGESFLFFVPVFGAIYIYKLYNLCFIKSLFFNFLNVLSFFMLARKTKLFIFYFNDGVGDGWGIIMFIIYSLAILSIYTIFKITQYLLKKLRS